MYNKSSVWLGLYKNNIILISLNNKPSGKKKYIMKFIVVYFNLVNACIVYVYFVFRTILV